MKNKNFYNNKLKIKTRIMKAYPMLKWAKELFPLCRSITGNGTRETLNYFKTINKEFKILKFKTGKKVFDWVIPQEWNIKDAYIEHESKKRFAEFKKCNLHIVNYSEPINKKISKKELLKHIHTDKKLPGAIPYVTSYYKRNWGFCLSQKQKKKLPKGKYKVVIDSEFKKGSLDMIHAILKGKSKKEIFFSTHVCHPSMANNELSGPVLLNAVLKYIKENYPNNTFSYRFVMHPETVGSIAYIFKHKNELKKNIICGINLSMVGDERAYTTVHSPQENTLADQALKAALIGKKNVINHSFLERGSDERQYCAPGIELPVCGFARSKDYPEYHTNKDDFKVVTEKGLQDSFIVVKTIIDAFELGLYPHTRVLCEPNLGKRNLYPQISKKENYKDGDIKVRTDLIAYANGKNNIFYISNLLNVPLSKICKEYSLLKSKKVLK